MNVTSMRPFRVSVLAAALVLGASLAGCAATPHSPAGAGDVRSKLTTLQGDETLSTLIPVELKKAEAAVILAEQPEGRDVALGRHRVYMADQAVEFAIAKAKTRRLEDQRAGFAEARGQARLAARTEEADQARDAAARAASDADVAREDAEAARRQSETDRSAAAAAAAASALEAAELQKQIDLLKAQATERGLVLTLGDLSFAFDSAELGSGGTVTLDRLVKFLGQYPERRVSIEGHTDNIGSDAYNQQLSERRADSVSRYLQRQGVAAGRLDVSGLGKSRPLASNDSDAGRQANRRVELIIDNPPQGLASNPTR